MLLNHDVETGELLVLVVSVDGGLLDQSVQLSVAQFCHGLKLTEVAGVGRGYHHRVASAPAGTVLSPPRRSLHGVAVVRGMGIADYSEGESNPRDRDLRLHRTSMPARHEAAGQRRMRCVRGGSRHLPACLRSRANSSLGTGRERSAIPTWSESTSALLTSGPVLLATAGSVVDGGYKGPTPNPSPRLSHPPVPLKTPQDTKPRASYRGRWAEDRGRSR